MLNWKISLRFDKVQNLCKKEMWMNEAESLQLFLPDQGYSSKLILER